MDLILLGACSVLIIVLIFCFFKNWKNKKEQNNVVRKNSGEKIAVNCPVCGMQLFKGENIISKVFRPMNVPDQYMTISGCPHCYPSCEPGLKRICPVCRKVMSSKDVLTARLFNKTAGKKHVHVVGCTNCHKSKFD